MKRVLKGDEQEDGGGTSGGSRESLKRPCKQKTEDHLEKEGAYWECLPQEILLHIFQYLPLLDRAYASQVFAVAKQRLVPQSDWSDSGL